jgi:carbon starvation protein CstA
MITFIVSIVLLLAGYFIYGRVVEKLFGADKDIQTPAIRLGDGVDYVQMPMWRIFMIQFLNIAGLGPIFGAVMGAMYGPSAFLWIVFGCIFAGAVHDYFAGMLSARHDGISIPEVVGHYMGNGFRQFMRGFSVVLLLLVGVVFILGPANIMTDLTKDSLSFGPLSVKDFWIYIIFIYYLAATILPIDKIIGKVYPVFGIVLFIMAAGLLFSIFRLNAPIPEVTFSSLQNMHDTPQAYPLFPMLFITIACGALSGFHATQSPMMARCIAHEHHGRHIFYGAMIAEGIVALIWAAAAMSFFGDTGGLNAYMADGGNAASAVKEICNSWLGKVGGILAILGVVACPITSGGTAFRSARMIIADFARYNQKPIVRRLIISIPLFIAAWFISRMNFAVVWRYFGFSNQTLATIVLWMSAMFMIKHKRNYWIAAIPATFMTAVCSTYILIAQEGFKLSTAIAYPAGIIAAATAFILFMHAGRRLAKAQ